MKIICKNIDETIELGNKIGKKLHKKNVIALVGPLGAGKTVLVKGIAKALGIEENITSPTFTIVSEYEGPINLYHMDLYRLNSQEEFDMIGIEDMLYSDAISIIEWSEKATSILPKDTIFISIDINENEERVFEIKGLEL